MRDYPQMALALGIAGIVTGEEFRARCPLHNDTKPSFSMKAITGVWICHAGCGRGEFTRLVEMVLNCTPTEARAWIEGNGQQMAVENMSRQLMESMAFYDQVKKPEAPKNWLPYYESLSSNVMPLWFLERGFTWETVQHWGIRYGPVQDAVVIPVRQPEGLIGVITRNHTGEPKYQNSEGLKKSEILFGEIKPNQNVILLVEGVLDAIWLWQLGYNAVSLLGHDLSRKQAKLVRDHRYGEVCLALDNDEVGRQGTRDAVNTLLAAGYLLPQLSYLKYPEGRKDAQDCTPEELATIYSTRKERTLDLLTLR